MSQLLCVNVVVCATSVSDIMGQRSRKGMANTVSVGNDNNSHKHIMLVF